ncbi:MAG: hypothetical protein K0S61_3382 [Anaerocolumna sp.]|nr:hypothetical protein [Anaerocolumna sp.]
MFELAIRYSYGKPAIIIAEESTRLPFDVVTENTIFYVNDPQGANDLKNQLMKFEENIDYEIETHGPIYDVIKSLPIYNKVESGESISNDEMMRYIISKIETLMNKTTQSDRSLIYGEIKIEVLLKATSDENINNFKKRYSDLLTAYTYQVDKSRYDNDKKILITMKNNIDKEHIFDLLNDIMTISEENSINIKFHINY